MCAGAARGSGCRWGSRFRVSYENHTSYPAPARYSLSGGISEPRFCCLCGVHFASKMGQLAGNHFITLTSAWRICLSWARPAVEGCAESPFEALNG